MHSYELSYWEREQFFRDIDYLIVGGGIVGLSAAIFIKGRKPKARVTVVDRGVLPIGASTRNAGFACFGSMTELLDDLKYSSEEEVMALVEQRFLGLQTLRGNYGDQNIGYQNNGGYEIFRASEMKEYQKCCDQMSHLNTLLHPIVGVPETFTQSPKTSETFGFAQVSKMTWNQAEGQLDTGMLMATLLRRSRELNVNFMGGITVENWAETGEKVYVSTTNNWQIEARKILIATNGFAKKILPGIDVQPARNQVLVTEPIPRLKIKGTFHYHQGYYYFRNIDGRILLGGGRHLDKTGETTTTLGEHKEIRESLLALLQSVILPNQDYQIAQWWSGIMGVGAQKAPLIQRINSHCVASVRLGGMGVALGTRVGEQGAKLLMES